MTFKVVKASAAQAEIDSFGEYAIDYSEDFAREQFTRLNHILTVQLAEAPYTWGYFFITGAPYHAYLFKVGRRTHYWIVYTIDEDAKRVNVLRFWNASRDTRTFSVE